MRNDLLLKPKKVRQGRYKKVLADQRQLEAEAQMIFDRLKPIFEMAKKNRLKSAEVAGLYILTYIQFRRPRDWLSSKLQNPLTYRTDESAFNLYNLPDADVIFRTSLRERLGKAPTVAQVFAHFSIRAVPLAVNHALIQWLDGKYDLQLTHVTPTPEEILSMQARARRCVTVVNDLAEMSRLVLNQRDPLGFTLHDLLHADRFFVQPSLVAGQIGFSRLMCRALQAKIFTALLAADSAFKHEFEYVIGDMNSYCVHMIKCLKAVCLGAFLRLENKPPNGQLSSDGLNNYDKFFAQLNDVWQAPVEVREALWHLNTPTENTGANHNQIIQNFFDDHGRLLEAEASDMAVNQ